MMGIGRVPNSHVEFIHLLHYRNERASYRNKPRLPGDPSAPTTPRTASTPSTGISTYYLHLILLHIIGPCMYGILELAPW